MGSDDQNEVVDEGVNESGKEKEREEETDRRSSWNTFLLIFEMALVRQGH
jgi:hypothetical protein